jgi:hypothetical protein
MTDVADHGHVILEQDDLRPVVADDPPQRVGRIRAVSRRLNAADGGFTPVFKQLWNRESFIVRVGFVIVLDDLGFSRLTREFSLSLNQLPIRHSSEAAVAFFFVAPRRPSAGTGRKGQGQRKRGCGDNPAYRHSRSVSFAARPWRRP